MATNHHQVLQDPPVLPNDREGQEGEEEESDTRDDGGIRSYAFDAPDLYAHGGPSDPETERDHWTSDPLQSSQDLQFVTFWWKDQGWGNRKGALFLRLVPSSPIEVISPEGDFSQEQEDGHRQLMPDNAEHEWIRVMLRVYPEDPLRRLARPGDRYCLSYVVGGGGGHVLQATGFTLAFTDISKSDAPYSRVLWKLDLGSNHLEGPIPPELADLKGLGLLRLDYNTFNGTVPEGLGDLEDLRVVEFNNNQLDVLPMELVKAWASAMDKVKLRVELQGNPWARPPESMVSLGLTSAERWWRDINRFGEGTSNKLKMVLVGLAEAGKTTIVRHLTGCGLPQDRTIGVEVTEWKPRDDLPLSVSLWDFAGQEEYYASHHIFLTKGALFVLVVDLFELATHNGGGSDDPRGAIFQWLDILHDRVPGAAVALVGTHTGRFLPLNIQNDYKTLLTNSGHGASGLFNLRYWRDGPRRLRINRFLSNARSMEAFHVNGPTGDRLSDEDLFEALDIDLAELSECQRQLAEAEECFNGLVNRYVDQKKEEIDLARSNAPVRRALSPGTESIDDSGGADEKREPWARSSFQRGYSTRGGPLIPVIIHKHIFRANQLRESVDELSTWVVDAAAGEHAPQENAFHFPAVRVVVSSAWVDATAAVEALGKRKGSPYVMWGEAVEAFQKYFQEQHGEFLQDAASVLQAAMEHREAEGGVLLSLQNDTSPAPDDIIHLDPGWLMELVRRVTDHNLVDQSKQDEIGDQLAAYCRTLPASSDSSTKLWDTHMSFINQGRLDKEYLRFLWLYRTLEEEEGYSGVPLETEAFESMLTTMIKCLFIYRSHSSSEDGREWFIVPARLPEDRIRKVLEDEIWPGEVVVRTTARFRRTHVPRGIIGRFLAFSASKIKYSGECWQHGAHVGWGDWTEILVCETLMEDRGKFPVIEIFVKGDTATALRVRKEVKETLKDLIQDDVHGYPGLPLPTFHPDPNPIRPTEFQRIICACLDIKLASITEVLEKISSDSRRMFQAAFPSLNKRSKYPRLVMLVPDKPAEEREVTPEEQTTKRGVVLLPKTWDRWARWCKSSSRTFRLVFLCEHDLSVVPCGPEGKGYPIADSAQLLKTFKPLLQASLWVVKIAVGVVSHVDLPLHDMLGALFKATTAEVVDNVQNVRASDNNRSLFNADAEREEGQTKEFKDLHGEAYESLCEFMREKESTKRAGCLTFLPWRSREAPTTTDDVDWRTHMVQVKNGIGGWAWVMNENKEAYTVKNGSR